MLSELMSLQVKLGWKAGNPISRVLSPLKNACVRHLQEAEDRQVILLGWRCAVMSRKEYLFDCSVIFCNYKDFLNLIVEILPVCANTVCESIAGTHPSFECVMGS